MFLFAGQSNMQSHGKTGILRGAGLVTQPAHPGTDPDYIPTSDQASVNEWIGSPASSNDTGLVYPYPTLNNSPCLYIENHNATATYYDGWGSYVKQYPTPSTGVLIDGSTYGPELSFLQKHLAAYPSVPLAAIKVAVGGTGLSSNWLPANTGSNATGTDRDCYAMMKDMIQQAASRLNGAGQSWKWGGFVWYQGESGAHPSSGILTDDPTYLSDARLMFSAVRSLTRADLPVVVGRIGDNWGWEGAGTTNANPHLLTMGCPYASIDADIHGLPASLAAYQSALPGYNAADQTTRENRRLSASTRRATQVTLGSDANCSWFSSDGGPVRPPFWPALNTYYGTNVDTELWGYHHAHPTILANGERAFAAYQTVRN